MQGPVVETSFNNKVISVNGKENLFELGLGIYCNDGSFPFSLARARFSNVISHRVNCEYCKCGDVVFHNIMHVTITMKTSPSCTLPPPPPAHSAQSKDCPNLANRKYYRKSGLKVFG